MSITQKELADRLSVSRVLVSRALNDVPGVAAKTRARIKAMATELGYRPNAVALQLKGGRSQLIGILIGAENATVNFERMMCLERLAFKRGYRSIIGQIHRDAEPRDAQSYLDDFRARGVDAIVLLHQTPQPEHFFPRLPAPGNNVVFFNNRPTPDSRCIRIDRGDGHRQAIRHLAGTGRKRIGLMLSHPPANDLADMRLKGYKKGLETAGLVFRERLVWSSMGTKKPDENNIKSAIRSLVQEQQADAILANNDYWGVDLIHSLLESGIRVPEEVAVVGFDNLDIGHAVRPALTTIDQCHEAFARCAMKMIEDIVAPGAIPPQPRLKKIKPKLILRESSQG